MMTLEGSALTSWVYWEIETQKLHSEVGRRLTSHQAGCSEVVGYVVLIDGAYPLASCVESDGMSGKTWLENVSLTAVILSNVLHRDWQLLWW